MKRGESRDILLKVSESYTGDPVTIPIHVVRAGKAGPVVLVTAAIHGDELNGMGIIHELIYQRPPELECGTLILVPVMNVFGFESQTRYMPDRRDLNRCFPGYKEGSLTSRVAHVLFGELIGAATLAIDLHTAAGGRTNFPNVRADLRNAEARRAARAFGTELIINSRGPEGSFRREATDAGCPTIILEAGEPGKIEPTVLEVGVRGVENVLRELGMLAGELIRPAYQARIDKSTWVRARVAGILRFHVAPGEIVEAGQPIATNVSVFGREQNVLTCPLPGIVIGMTTLPAVKPGEPVCHVGVPTRPLRALRKALAAAPDDGISQRVRDDLATNIAVSEKEVDQEAEEVRDRE